MDTPLHRLAATQHGLVARRQAMRLGLRPTHLNELVRTRHLAVVVPGVYEVLDPACRPAERLRTVMATVLRAGRDARVGGALMLELAGIPVDRPATWTVLVPQGPRAEPPPDGVRFDPHHRIGTTAVLDGVPTWTVPRNLLEAAAAAPDAQSVCLLRAVVGASDIHALAEAAELAERHPAHPGAARLLASGIRAVC